jgi:hypothetical protein
MASKYAIERVSRPEGIPAAARGTQGEMANSPSGGEIKGFGRFRSAPLAPDAETPEQLRARVPASLFAPDRVAVTTPIPFGPVYSRLIVSDGYQILE